ncbi:MAG TPA: aminotransferase class V-fold PLP-dependent enzyme, partial [Vicinamibacterales bacterium]|nr:aminotransferase class V-fold PLP-dependent enzyme [Vicinamibacterales bacterium]
MMTPMLEAVRRVQFPALADKTFLDAACASLAPQAAADAIAALLGAVQTYPERSATAFHIRLDAARDAARPAAARLIGARPEDIALIENTSHGLAIAAAAIPLEAGDNILVPDLEYLQVPLPWRQQPAPSAPEIRLVPHADGTLPVDRFAAAADGRTRAVVMSSVQWSNGFRADLDAIGAFCRERRLWFVVDGI